MCVVFFFTGEDGGQQQDHQDCVVVFCKALYHCVELND
jgi:hypothetical protein